LLFERTSVDLSGLRPGGAGGIRTLDTVNRIPDFESGAFDHSATAPDSVRVVRRPKF
jgi:hypothetical protein